VVVSPSLFSPCGAPLPLAFVCVVLPLAAGFGLWDPGGGGGGDICVGEGAVVWEVEVAVCDSDGGDDDDDDDDGGNSDGGGSAGVDEVVEGEGGEEEGGAVLSAFCVIKLCIAITY